MCVFGGVVYRNDDVCERPDQGLGLAEYAKGEYCECCNTCMYMDSAGQRVKVRLKQETKGRCDAIREQGLD